MSIADGDESYIIVSENGMLNFYVIQRELLI